MVSIVDDTDPQTKQLLDHIGAENSKRSGRIRGRRRRRLHRVDRRRSPRAGPKDGARGSRHRFPDAALSARGLAPHLRHGDTGAQGSPTPPWGRAGLPHCLRLLRRRIQTVAPSLLSSPNGHGRASPGTLRHAPFSYMAIVRDPLSTSKRHGRVDADQCCVAHQVETEEAHGKHPGMLSLRPPRTDSGPILLTASAAILGMIPDRRLSSGAR